MNPGAALLVLDDDVLAALADATDVETDPADVGLVVPGLTDGDDPEGKYDTSPVGTPGGRQNWVDKAGGLPPFIRAVAHALIRAGRPKGTAIAIAIGQIKRWAAGGGDVSAKTRAKAVKTIAQWEKMKAASGTKAHHPSSDFTTCPRCGSDKMSFPEGKQPRCAACQYHVPLRIDAKSSAPTAVVDPLVVRGLGDGFEVGGLDTESHRAGVVDVKAEGDRPEGDAVGDAVDEVGAVAVDADDAVPVAGSGASPEQAPRGIIAGSSTGQPVGERPAPGSDQPVKGLPASQPVVVRGAESTSENGQVTMSGVAGHTASYKAAQGAGYEMKEAKVSVVDVVDEEQGIVDVLVSVTGIKDRVNDVIVPGAYAKSLGERTPKGVWSHSWEKPVSKTLESQEVMPGDAMLKDLTLRDGSPWPAEAGALRVRTQFNLQGERGKQAFADVKFFADDQEWSIGYNVPKGGAEFKGGVRYIKQLDLYEYSPVLFGAMPSARTLAVKSLQDALDADVEDVAEAWRGEVKIEDGEAERNEDGSKPDPKKPHEFKPGDDGKCEVCGLTIGGHKAAQQESATGEEKAVAPHEFTDGGCSVCGRARDDHDAPGQKAETTDVCGRCGSDDLDEYKDGRVECADCGNEVRGTTPEVKDDEPATIGQVRAMLADFLAEVKGAAVVEPEPVATGEPEPVVDHREPEVEKKGLVRLDPDSPLARARAARQGV